MVQTNIRIDRQKKHRETDFLSDTLNTFDLKAVILSSLGMRVAKEKPSDMGGETINKSVVVMNVPEDKQGKMRGAVRLITSLRR